MYLHDHNTYMMDFLKRIELRMCSLETRETQAPPQAKQQITCTKVDQMQEAVIDTLVSAGYSMRCNCQRCLIETLGDFAHHLRSMKMVSGSQSASPSDDAYFMAERPNAPRHRENDICNQGPTLRRDGKVVSVPGGMWRSSANSMHENHEQSHFEEFKTPNRWDGVSHPNLQWDIPGAPNNTGRKVRFDNPVGCDLSATPTDDAQVKLQDSGPR